MTSTYLFCMHFVAGICSGPTRRTMTPKSKECGWMGPTDVLLSVKVTA